MIIINDLVHKNFQEDHLYLGIHDIKGTQHASISIRYSF